MKLHFIILTLAMTLSSLAQTTQQIDSLENRYIRALQISDDPSTGFSRVVVFNRLDVSSGSQILRVYLKVFQFSQDTLIRNSASISNPYRIVLTAHNGQWVDTNGVDVPAEIEDTDSTTIPNPARYKTEYRFYVDLADGDTNIFDLIAQQIQAADALKRFDR